MRIGEGTAVLGLPFLAGGPAAQLYGLTNSFGACRFLRPALLGSEAVNSLQITGDMNIKRGPCLSSDLGGSLFRASLRFL